MCNLHTHTHTKASRISDAKLGNNRRRNHAFVFSIFPILLLLVFLFVLFFAVDISAPLLHCRSHEREHNLPTGCCRMSQQERARHASDAGMSSLKTEESDYGEPSASCSPIRHGKTFTVNPFVNQITYDSCGEFS